MDITYENANLKLLITHHKIRHKRIAEILGISQGHWSKIINEKLPIPKELVAPLEAFKIKLVKEFGIGYEHITIFDFMSQEAKDAMVLTVLDANKPGLEAYRKALDDMYARHEERLLRNGVRTSEAMAENASHATGDAPRAPRRRRIS